MFILSLACLSVCVSLASAQLDAVGIQNKRIEDQKAFNEQYRQKELSLLGAQKEQLGSLISNGSSGSSQATKSGSPRSENTDPKASEGSVSSKANVKEQASSNQQGSVPCDLEATRKQPETTANQPNVAATSSALLVC
jgi:hypothetical protein